MAFVIFELSLVDSLAKWDLDTEAFSSAATVPIAKIEHFIVHPVPFLPNRVLAWKLSNREHKRLLFQKDIKLLRRTLFENHIGYFVQLLLWKSGSFLVDEIPFWNANWHRFSFHYWWLVHNAGDCFLMKRWIFMESVFWCDKFFILIGR